MVKIEIIYHPGTGGSSPPEDFIIFSPPYWGVGDAFSPPHLPGELSLLGYFVGRVAREFFRKVVSPVESISIMEDLNAFLGKAFEGIFLPSDPASRPGASLILARLGEDEAELSQVGDCLAAWETERGEKGATPNPLYWEEERLLRRFRKCYEAAEGDRCRAWGKFLPFLRAVRRARGWGGRILQGLPVSLQINEWKWGGERLRRLMLFSDGAVPFSWTVSPEFLAKRVWEKIDEGGGLRALFEAREEALHSGSLPEATAMLIEF